MKKHLLFVVCLCPLLGFSQSIIDQKQNELFGQGHLQVGMNIGGTLGNISTGPIQYITPRIQYFLKDAWSITLESRHNKNNLLLGYTGLGLSSRYYFIRDRRLALFGQIGASIGQSRSLLESLNVVFYNLPLSPFSYERQTAWQTTAGLGLHFRLAERWSLELLGERARTQLSMTTSYQEWQSSLGTNFLLK